MREGPTDVSIEQLQREESFEGAVFTGLDLQGQDLGAREFTDCAFIGCKAQETRWKGSRLDGCRFERCDLTRMQPRGMLAHDVRFVDSKLMGVEWAELGQFPNLSFIGCVLDFASFVGLSLRRTEFRGCKIDEANFFDADLREAEFAGSDLRGSIFRGCKLARTDFSGATGVFIDPSINEARGARVSIETAALLAMHLGLEVADLQAPAGEPGRPARGRGKSRRG